MKIWLATHVFSLAIGGIESCPLDLARAFSKLGHEVQATTQTPSNNPANDYDLKVIRRPHKSVLAGAIRWFGIFLSWPIWCATTGEIACKNKALRFLRS